MSVGDRLLGVFQALRAREDGAERTPPVDALCAGQEGAAAVLIGGGGGEERDVGEMLFQQSRRLEQAFQARLVLHLVKAVEITKVANPGLVHHFQVFLNLGDTGVEVGVGAGIVLRVRGELPKGDSGDPHLRELAEALGIPMFRRCGAVDAVDIHAVLAQEHVLEFEAHLGDLAFGIDFRQPMPVVAVIQRVGLLQAGAGGECEWPDLHGDSDSLRLGVLGLNRDRPHIGAGRGVFGHPHFDPEVQILPGRDALDHFGVHE